MSNLNVKPTLKINLRDFLKKFVGPYVPIVLYNKVHGCVSLIPECDYTIYIPDHVSTSSLAKYLDMKVVSLLLAKYLDMKVVSLLPAMNVSDGRSLNIVVESPTDQDT